MRPTTQKIELSASELYRLLRYNRHEGTVVWTGEPSAKMSVERAKKRAGKSALHKQGNYYVITVDGHTYRAVFVIYKLITGRDAIDDKVVAIVSRDKNPLNLILTNLQVIERNGVIEKKLPAESKLKQKTEIQNPCASTFCDIDTPKGYRLVEKLTGLNARGVLSWLKATYPKMGTFEIVHGLSENIILRRTVIISRDLANQLKAFMAEKEIRDFINLGYFYVSQNGARYILNLHFNSDVRYNTVEAYCITTGDLPKVIELIKEMEIAEAQKQNCNYAVVLAEIDIKKS